MERASSVVLHLFGHDHRMSRFGRDRKAAVAAHARYPLCSLPVADPIITNRCASKVVRAETRLKHFEERSGWADDNLHGVSATTKC